MRERVEDAEREVRLDAEKRVETQQREGCLLRGLPLSNLRTEEPADRTSPSSAAAKRSHLSLPPAASHAL